MKRTTGKRVRPMGKAFDDTLTDDHGVSQYRTLEMRNKIEEQNFRSNSASGVIHPKH